MVLPMRSNPMIILFNVARFPYNTNSNFRKIRTLACCQRKMCALVTLGNRPTRPQGLTCNITMWSACWITLIQIFFTIIYHFLMSTEK